MTYPTARVVAPAAVAAALAAVTAVIACSSNRASYHCSSDDQCVDGASHGVCGPGGFCAFPHPQCDGGYRFESNAGAGVAGTCVPPRDAASGPGCTGVACTSCVRDIRFGRRFGCLLKTDGTVWCSGENLTAQLGDGTTGGPNRTTWTQVVDTTGAIDDASGLGVGRDHACVVRGTTKEVWCWGSNAHGQVGDGATLPSPPVARAKPVSTGTSFLSSIAEVRPGERHTCARSSVGEVWCWGANDTYDLGDNTTTRRNIAARVLETLTPTFLAQAIDLDTYESTSCATKTDNSVWCWGDNSSGQFGNGSMTHVPIATKIAAQKEVTVGKRQICWVEADTTISCTGNDRHGTLANGVVGRSKSTNYLNPVKVGPPGLPLRGVAEASLLGGGACAVMADSTVSCWGDSLYGQTGTGQGEPYAVQVATPDGSPIRNVDTLGVGRAHVCAHSTVDGWLCWGRNADGELGDGTFDNRSTPSPLIVTCP